MHNVEDRSPLRLFIGALAFAAATLAPAASADLDIGDVAPDFALQGSDGAVHRLADYRGRSVVVAWFPKAFTGG